MATTRKRVVGVYNVGLIEEKLPRIPEKAAGVARLVLMSDTHQREASFAASIPPGDVFVYAGDLTSTGSPSAISAFATFLRSLPHKEKVVICGNHDLSFDGSHYEKKWKRYHQAKVDASKEIAGLKSACTYLENSSATVAGLRFWGSPWSPEFCDWAFNLAPDQLAPTWAKIPGEIDVVVTHGPCKGHGGMTARGEEAGDAVLLDVLVNRVKPALHVSGHIHEGYGVSTEAGITFANASSVNFHYRPTNRPIVVDLA